MFLLVLENVSAIFAWDSIWEKYSETDSHLKTRG